MFIFSIRSAEISRHRYYYIVSPFIISITIANRFWHLMLATITAIHIVYIYNIIVFAWVRLYSLNHSLSFILPPAFGIIWYTIPKIFSKYYCMNNNERNTIRKNNNFNTKKWFWFHFGFWFRRVNGIVPIHFVSFVIIFSLYFLFFFFFISLAAHINLVCFHFRVCLNHLDERKKRIISFLVLCRVILCYILNIWIH